MDKNKVSIHVECLSEEVIYVTYPGFCSLMAEGGEECEPRLLCGLATVTDSTSLEYKVGERVLFFGFADRVSVEYVTSRNCVCHVQDEVVDISLLAKLTFFVYVLGLLEVQAGMSIYYEPTIVDSELLAEVIRFTGCIVSADKKVCDRAVERTVERSNRIQQRTIVLGPGTTAYNCCSLGQDFNIDKYMQNGVIVPNAYMHLSTAKNISTAYGLLKRSSPATNITDDTSECTIPVLATAKKAYKQHINPCVATICVTTREMEKGKYLALGIVVHIIGSCINSFSKTLTKVGEVYSLSFEDGSVATCVIQKQSSEKITWEVHFDSMSYIMNSKKRCITYTETGAEIVKNSAISDDEISALVALGKSINISQSVRWGQKQIITERHG